VDFNREVRPILAGKCFQCHGPDDGARKAGLRFDQRDVAIKELKTGHRAIVPGDSGKSEVTFRVTHADPATVMPPPKTGKKLSEKEIATLKKWIDEGAKYSLHWSYVKPVRPSLPDVKKNSWPRNDVDAFILARLEKEGLIPTAPADKYAIVRRL